MAGLGIDSDQIEQARDSAEAFRDPQATPQFVVWRENAAIVRVFCDCSWQCQVVVGTEGGVMVRTGIGATEVASVCDLHGLAAGTRGEVLWGVRIMEQVALPLLNERR